MCVCVCACVAQALQVLKDHCVVHGDLKPSNILWRTDALKLTVLDLGVSEQLPSANVTTWGFRGTEGWTAPEVEAESRFGIAADMYSAGKTLDMLLSHCAARGAQARDLVQRMMCRSAEERVTPEQACAHKLFENPAASPKGS